MTSQERGELHSGFGLGLIRREKDRHHRRPRHDDPDNLGFAASNRTITATLIIGISLMLLILMLPYLSEI
ncbi:hypothetical protein [Nesterenkonia natronophila]|uniref:Uncharacterized protein n=1 Tax=Nesterenkonia natronophila TaxID=2174932 RepID=A0A3A4F3J5_9MICC|nr:hypothetical protein [Nesterenkonia natronophila]RJN32428.1 hypothetical protein D3250_00830 [Nesterenkonia natronophila]